MQKHEEKKFDKRDTIISYDYTKSKIKRINLNINIQSYHVNMLKSRYIEFHNDICNKQKYLYSRGRKL